MLRIARLNDRTGRYYLADLAAELDGVDLVDGSSRDASGGTWLGAGAAGLGLSGRVGPAPLAEVLRGAHPLTGRRLSVHRTAVSGYDLTFAAPKSVSALFALGGPEGARASLDAHRSAVDAAMAYVTSHAVAVRRGSGDERRLEPVEGVVAASFTHGVSRALDPHLHTHVVVANLAHGTDGRWTAIDGRGLSAHARAAGALYDAQVRHALVARLGTSWSMRGSGAYELAQIDPLLLGVLSVRRAEIRERVAVGFGGDAGSVSRRARTVAWAATRDPKAQEITARALRASWHDRARDVGASIDGLVLDGRHVPRVHAEGSVDEHRFAAALWTAPHGGVARRDVVAAWAWALEGGTPVAAAERCVDAIARWDGGVGVAERLHAPREVVPASHVLRVLGPRPSVPHELALWLSASGALDRYRRRWLPDNPSQTCTGPRSFSERARMPARQLLEHLALTREVDETLVRLGRGRGRNRRVERSAGPDSFNSAGRS